MVGSRNNDEVDLDSYVDSSPVRTNTTSCSTTTTTTTTTTITDVNTKQGWQLPTLFRINNRGDIRVWLIGFNGEQLVSSWGTLQAYQSGHMQTAHTQVTLNTSGRGLNDQAMLEANNAWKRKHELEGYRQEVIDKNIYECEAMLASEFTEKCLKVVDYPVYVQPKLDGIRCRADDYNPTHGDINLVSRGAQAINHFNHIREQLVPFFDMAKQLMSEMWPDRPAMLRLDGELFTFDADVDFDKLSGSTRLQYDRSSYEKKVDYYIFDVDFAFDLPYPDRWSFIYDVFEHMNDYNNSGNDNGNNGGNIITNNCVVDDKGNLLLNNTNLRLVMSYVANNLDDIHALHADFEGQKYEGAIVRRTVGPRSMYCYGRTTAMYKLKTFRDAEFTIVGADTAKGTENGCVVWVLQTVEGKTFKVRPCGTLDERRQLLRDYHGSPNQYQGQLYRVKFQDYTKTGIPRFPVGVGFVYDRTPQSAGYTVSS
jgi:hypothetical protein